METYSEINFHQKHDIYIYMYITNAYVDTEHGIATLTKGNIHITLCSVGGNCSLNKRNICKDTVRAIHKFLLQTKRNIIIWVKFLHSNDNNSFTH